VRALSALGMAYAAAGRMTDARQQLERLLALAHERHVSPNEVALVYAWLGDADAAFAWLERALEGRESQLVYLAVDPAWEPLHDDPRFEALLHRLGLPSLGGGRPTGGR
jgi:tetratricopeptide (TPR) repeat protein